MGGAGLTKFALALLAGFLSVARDPENWSSLRLFVWHEKNFLIHCVVFVIVVMYLPLSVPDIRAGGGGAAALVATHFQNPAASLFNVITQQAPIPELLFFMKFSLGFMPLAVLMFSVITDESKGYIKKMYAFICVFLIMYSMSIPTWESPSMGFVGLLYLVYGFFTC